MKRNRIHYLLLSVTTIITGLASRYFSNYLPEFINLGLGDALYALMMYWLVAFVVPRLSIRQLSMFSLVICYLIELSQLLQFDWLNAIRSNPFGALVLGRGFLWSDLVAYALGIALGALIESYLIKPRVLYR